VSLLRAWSIPAIRPMLTSRPYPLYVVRQHARRPSFRLVRGSVGDQSADILVRARGAFERACRTATPTSCLARGGAACRLLLRFAASGSSAMSSWPAALPRSPRLQPARSRPPLASVQSSSLTARSSFLRGPFLIAFAEQSPAHATVKQSSPRSRRSLVQRRRTAAAPAERTNANLGKRICSRQTDDARTKLAAGSERRMESACADHHKCVRSKATAGGKCRPGCMETSHLRCKSDRWTYEVACEG